MHQENLSSPLLEPLTLFSITLTLTLTQEAIKNKAEWASGKDLDGARALTLTLHAPIPGLEALDCRQHCIGPNVPGTAAGVY